MAFDLPDELIFEILLRLPVKSICRFTCVSKRWLHIISSGPKSVRNIYNQRPKPPHYLVLENCSEVSEEDINNKSYLQRPSWCKAEDRFIVVDMLAGRVHDKFKLQLRTPQNHSTLMQSCHGLVLITLCLPMLKTQLYIVNPSIHGRLNKIPILPFGRQIHAAGLGYLPSKNQYKIVAWFDGVSSDDYHFRQMGCSILTITDGGKQNPVGGWRDIPVSGVPWPLRAHEKHQRPQCMNSVLYFWSYKETQEIIGFDLEKEEFRVIPCPPSEWVEIRGELCCSRLADTKLMLYIYALRNNVWEQIYEIDIQTMMPCPVRVLAHVSADYEAVEELVLLTEEQGLVYYNLKTRIFRVPEYLSHIRFLESSNLASSFVYVDSFFSFAGL